MLSVATVGGRFHGGATPWRRLRPRSFLALPPASSDGGGESEKAIPLLVERYRDGVAKRYLSDGNSKLQVHLEKHESLLNTVEDENANSLIPGAIRDFVLPAGFPGSVSDDYLEYMLLQFPTNVTGWICYTLVTSSLLKAVGVGSFTGTSALAQTLLRSLRRRRHRPTAADMATIAALSGATTSAPKPSHHPILPRSLPSARRMAVGAPIRCSAVSPAAPLPAPPASPLRPWGPSEPRKGADILVEALERCGVSDVFAYPGGASMEIHQALTRSPVITNHLFRHEQGESFAASGYARASGRVGVCVATSGPGATNLVSALADALLDSVPMVAITGQVPRRMIGTDAFQETPIVEVTRSITKHNYLVLDVDDIPRVVQEAFFLASSGRPGPVLVDIPKDIQQQMAVPVWDTPMSLPGYIARLPKPPATELLEQVLRLVGEARRPILYVGGGCSASGDELRRFVELTGIPVTTTLMGLGNFPSDDPLSLRMLGMHGTVYANYAVDKADLLLAFGVRFDDRVTGKIETFASRAKIVHIDIDPAEIGKNKQPHVSICADVKLALQGLNALLEGSTSQKSFDFGVWHNELEQQKREFPLGYKTFGEETPPQYAIQVLDELAKGEAIIATGVGQHQMWAAQYYTYKRPRQWLSSAGLGAMGFGLPAAAGAAVANPGVTVVDIDGDGSFLMNIQELAMIHIENLPVKVMVLNNQHLGMVVQWEDRFYKANRAHTYLGNPENESEIYPDFVTIAKGFNIPAVRVTKKSEVREAIKKMLETPGPYLLDVIVPHQEHVLPMIPSGGAFKDMILDGDGRTVY